MEIEAIEKKIELVNKIKEFDAMIIKLGRMANNIDNGCESISINLSMELPKKAEYKDEAKCNIGSGSFMISLPWASISEVKNTESATLQISELFTYEIFQLIYNRTIEEREKLIRKL